MLNELISLFVPYLPITLVGLVAVCAYLLYVILGPYGDLKCDHMKLNEDLSSQSMYIVKLESKLAHTASLDLQLDQLRYKLSEEYAMRKASEERFTSEQRHWKEKLTILESAEKRLQDAFKVVSQDVLQMNNQTFLQLAKSTFEQYQQSAAHSVGVKLHAFEELITPLNQALQGVDGKIGELEKARLSAYDLMKHQINELVSSQQGLRQETLNLVNALRTPNIRGRWGEMQLKRVVELTGMSQHCDFIEQAHVQNDEERMRPDMVVKLPGKKRIIIDAKAPMGAYLEAIDIDDESLRNLKLKDHARQVRAHINALSSRAYWDQFKEDTPEFVVLFLPGETFFTAALAADPQLIELGVEKKVILTTPATLIAMLHAIAYGWKQQSVEKNAQEISLLGREVYKRLSDMGSHISKLGRDLNAAVKSFNNTVGTLERRVLPAARKFKDLEASSAKDDLIILENLECTPRELTCIELSE